MILLAGTIGFAIGYFSNPGPKAPVPQQQMFFAGISCQSVHDLLPAMMRNELDAARTAQLRDHVMQCPECRQLLEQMKATGSIGATLDQFLGDAQALASAVRASAGSEL